MRCVYYITKRNYCQLLGYSAFESFLLPPKQPKESFNTKNRHEKLDFFAWLGTTCDSFLLVLKKPPFAVIGKGGFVLY